MSPYAVVDQFESALSAYTGAPFVVCCSSGSAAILMAMRWFWLQDKGRWKVEIPKRTYMSVPANVYNAGFDIKWVDFYWRGAYQLKPYPVWDCARRFTGGMYEKGQFQCLSFAASKILGIEQGGAILHDDPKADEWFRRMRFDGRTAGVDPHDDQFTEAGYHCPMLPSIAAVGVQKLHFITQLNYHNDDLPDYPYPDLSEKCLYLR